MAKSFGIDWDQADRQIQTGLRSTFAAAFEAVAAARPHIQARLRELDRRVAAMQVASRSGEQPPPPPPGSAGNGGGTNEGGE